MLRYETLACHVWPSAAADLCQVRKQADGEARYGEALTGWQMMAAMSGVSGLKSPTLVNGGLAAAAMQSP